MQLLRPSLCLALCFGAACGSSSTRPPSSDAGQPSGRAPDGGSDGSNTSNGSNTSDGSIAVGGEGDASTGSGSSPQLGGCSIFPADHIFNTPIADLPTHPNSQAFMAQMGDVQVHLDLGQSENMGQADTYYGIPYNVVHGNSLTWPAVAYTSQDSKDMSWDPRPESDCAVGGSHMLVSPCTAAAAPNPVLPIPSNVLVEGGIFPDVAGQTYGDHHILLLDADTCRLWEAYHAYTGASESWHIFGSSTWDLRSNALRPADWTSADAAGFPILPLLLKAEEASSGEIRHALRFTIDSSSIRTEYTWPARHLTNNGTSSQDLPPMGQLFRLKASYMIPASFSTQSKAILQAMKTYGLYLADGGSNLYVQGEPNAKWSDAIFDEVQSVDSSQFEAVDLSPIHQRAGFDANSAAVPKP